MPRVQVDMNIAVYTKAVNAVLLLMFYTALVAEHTSIQEKKLKLFWKKVFVYIDLIQCCCRSNSNLCGPPFPLNESILSDRWAVTCVMLQVLDANPSRRRLAASMHVQSLAQNLSRWRGFLVVFHAGKWHKWKHFVAFVFFCTERVFGHLKAGWIKSLCDQKRREVVRLYRRRNFPLNDQPGYKAC